MRRPVWWVAMDWVPIRDDGVAPTLEGLGRPVPFNLAYVGSGVVSLFELGIGDRQDADHSPSR